MSIVVGALWPLPEVVQDAEVAPADESAGKSAPALSDTNRAPGVSVETARPDRAVGIRRAGLGHAVSAVTADRSPATMALPAALPALEGGASAGGIPSRRRWRSVVRRCPGVNLPGRLEEAVGSQARCSRCPFGMATLTPWLERISH